MGVPVWTALTRDLHGFVPEAFQLVVEEEGGCMRKAKTKTQGGKTRKNTAAQRRGRHKGRIYPHSPYALAWFFPFFEISVLKR